MKRQLFVLMLICFATLFAQAQTADLMDVKFQANGSAKNTAAAGTLTTPLTITTPGATPQTVYEPAIKQFVSRFDGTSGGGVYKLLYKDNANFKLALEGSFTIETYVKINTDEDKAPVSAQESGGFGIEHKGNSSGNTQLWYNYENSGRKTVTVGNQSIYSSSNPQFYHVVYVVSRSGNDATITAYYNGVANGSSNITGSYYPPANADAHWVGIGGDAHPTFVSQYWLNGDVAYAKMYSSALTQSEIQGLYNQLNTRASLTKVDQLNTIIGSKLPAFISFSADVIKKAAAQSLLTVGWDLMNNLAATDNDIQNYFDQINSQVGSLEPEVSTLPVFAVISDTHVGNDKGWAEKLNRGIDQLIAQSPKLDAVFINGDVTDWGTQAQYTNAKNLFARLEAAVPVYYLMGNHDWFTAGANNFFSNTLGQSVNQYVEIKGYPFITVSMERSTYPDAYTQPSQDFLTEKIALAKATYPGKPIFVFAHMPVTGTVYGSYTIGGGDNWGTAGLKAICEANPEVILFSGHSHYPLGDERSIHQDKFTSINEGSMTYSEIESGKSEGIHPPGYLDVTEGCFVSIQNNGDVKVKRWDFTRKEEIKQPWIISPPFIPSNFAYKTRTGGTAPYFELSDKPTISDISDKGAKVSFPQGKDDDLVHHYVVELMNESDVVLASPKYTVFSGFFLNSAKSSSKTWEITGLAASTKYKVRVTGVDSYGNVSVPPIVSNQFTTNAYVVAPGTVLATPDLLDVKFKPNGNASDASAKAWTIAKGATTPNTAYDNVAKQYTNVSNGTSSQYFKVDYQNDASFKDVLKAGFTLESFVKTTATTVISAVSSQESGGFGFEQANGGDTKFWFRKSSSAYDQSTHGKLNTDTYYHLVATWDNTSKKIVTYLNGVPVTEKVLAGSDVLTLSPTAAAQWIAIGGDANGGANVQSAYKGSVAATRLYGKALSRDEVVLAYQQIQARQALTHVDELNTALTTAIPNATNINQTQKDDLLTQGWALMNDLNTTDPQIEAFLATVSSTLPVTLTSFNAKLVGSQVKLTWTTSSESNSARFEIYRSEDAKNYTKIDEVQAAGNSVVKKSYYFVDNQPNVGTNYYRLKQIDRNGDVQQFSAVAIITLLGNKLTLGLSSLSETSVLASVYSPKTVKGTLIVSNLNGQELAKQNVIIAQGNNKFELPVSAAKGLLIVSLLADGNRTSQKVVR